MKGAAGSSKVSDLLSHIARLDSIVDSLLTSKVLLHSPPPSHSDSIESAGNYGGELHEASSFGPSASSDWLSRQNDIRVPDIVVSFATFICTVQHRNPYLYHIPLYAHRTSALPAQAQVSLSTCLVPSRDHASKKLHPMLQVRRSLQE